MEKLTRTTCGISLLLGLLSIVGISVHAWAQTPNTSLMAVEFPWARATPAGAKTGASYMTLTNKGHATERLLGATTPMAEEIQFHRATQEDGIARMRELRAIEIAPADTLILKPGDIHVMMVGLKAPLKEGQTFPLILEFETAGIVKVVVSVAGIGAMDHDMSRMKH